MMARSFAKILDFTVLPARLPVALWGYRTNSFYQHRLCDQYLAHISTIEELRAK